MSLQLFGCWVLRAGDQRLGLRIREQRLVALLALQGTRTRGYVAGTLWPTSTDPHAATNLRTAVWRVQHTTPGLLSLSHGMLALAPTVRSDVQDFLSATDAALANPGAFCDERAIDRFAAQELLPGWYDDWVLSERDRLQHLSVRALEAVSRFHLDGGDPELAVAAARAAHALEPLRETPLQLAIRGHLAAGNRSDALLAFRGYRSQLAEELGIGPSPLMLELANTIVPEQRRPPRGSRATTDR